VCLPLKESVNKSVIVASRIGFRFCTVLFLVHGLCGIRLRSSLNRAKYKQMAKLNVAAGVPVKIQTCHVQAVSAVREFELTYNDSRNIYEFHSPLRRPMVSISKQRNILPYI